MTTAPENHDYAAIHRHHLEATDTILTPCTATDHINCPAAHFDADTCGEGNWHTVRVAPDGLGSTSVPPWIIISDTQGRTHPFHIGSNPIYILKRRNLSEQLADALTAAGVTATPDPQYSDGFALAGDLRVVFTFNNPPHNGTVIVKHLTTGKEIHPPLHAHDVTDAANVAADLIASETATGAGQ
jgi:hypothetical protein